MPVVLVLAAAGSNLLLLYYLGQPRKGDALSAAVFGLEPPAANNLALLENNFPIDSDTFAEDGHISFAIVDSAYLLNENNPLSGVLPTREGLIIYKIQKGDNLSKIAASFGISLNTIFWANPDVKSHSLTPGQEIVILPVSGVLHQIQEGETLESIAGEYSADEKKIIQYNPSIARGLTVGNTIVIPEAKPAQGQLLASVNNLPSYPGFFAIPTTGWNWGQLHHYNAVDIANACGTPIYSSAEGLVVESVMGGWNGGYGNYILIEHPNGTKTKYAHNEKNLASVGDYVLKGDLIGYIGNTGETHGPTGCHLHFEVYGAKNPFAK